MAGLITRVFMNGNSQAVRIPHELRLDTTEVEIRRNEAGELLIRALPADRGAALLQALQGFDDHFTQLLQDDRQDSAPPQEREAR